MAADPICTDPDKYQVIFENERVRVLEYHDRPGDQTTPHRHPDSVMVTLSGFRRRLHADLGARDVALEAGRAHWLPAQVHAGENTGTTPTHVLFVELKDTAQAAASASPSSVLPDAELSPVPVRLTSRGHGGRTRRTPGWRASRPSTCTRSAPG
jgi:quercetin dioxygenase-like cupin family protein